MNNHLTPHIIKHNYYIENSGSGLGQAQKNGGVKPVNELPAPTPRLW